MQQKTLFFYFSHMKFIQTYITFREKPVQAMMIEKNKECNEKIQEKVKRRAEASDNRQSYLSISGEF